MSWKETIKVLLIEDNLDLLEMEQTHFEMNGYKNVFVAKNSDEAEEVLRTHKIDLCVSDIKFPTKNGVELMRSAKENSQTPQFLIFMSGFNDYSLSELQVVGACGYFEKPVAFKEVFDFIDEKFKSLEESKAS